MDNAEEALSLSQLDLNEEGDSLTIFSIFNDKIQNPNSKDIWKDINNGDYDNNAVIANNEEICFIVGKLNGSDERITLFSIVGTISEADSFSSKIEALADIFTIYVHKNYLKDNKEIPYGFLDGGEYITSEINLVSVTKQGMNDFICDIYAKLLILKEASQKDTDLAYEFKYYLKSAYKAMLTKKFPVNK